MRLQKDDIPFTMVANDVLRNPTLSWKSKGMYAYLFSKPDYWEFSNRRIVTESMGGRHIVLAALKELESAGLLMRIKLPSGKMLYNLKHAPDQSPKTGPRLFDPKSENPKVQKPEGAKTRPINNTVKEVIQSKKEDSREYTPGEFARRFFAGDPEIVGPTGQALEASGIPAQMVVRELLKFKNYWTEPTKSGKKTRWELQPTFDVKRRIGTWFRNIAERQGAKGNRAGAGVTL